MKLYRRIVVVGVGILLMASVIRQLHAMTTVTPVMADLSNLPVIVIDPGHGGIDGGAVGIDDIVEKDINLAISLTLRDMFVASGFEVVMNRETDVSIHDEGITSTRGQKTSDLHNRLAIMEEYPGGIFLSIHQNKFGQSSSWGTQVFFGPQNANSEKLAGIIQEDIAGSLQPENSRQIKPAGKNLYLMYNAECPAVLVECGFLSNRDEAYKLTDHDYQSKIAFVTFTSVLRFLELDSPGLDSDGVEGYAQAPIQE